MGPHPAFLCLALLLAACGTTGATQGSGEAGAEGAAPDATMVAAAPVLTPIASEYRVSPHDILDITVWQVPNLNRTVQVGATGTISLPLVGVVPAAGRTAGDIEKAIAGKLSATYMQNPQVSVSVKEAAGRSVTVDGAVMKPGVFPLTGSISLMQAIAQAGGLSDVADPALVSVRRVVDGQPVQQRYSLTAIKSGAEQDPSMLAGDIVVVADSQFKTGLRDTARTIAPITSAVGILKPW